MKTKDIARIYGVDQASFEKWLRQSGHRHKVGGLGGVVVDDDHEVPAMVESFRHYCAELERTRLADAARARQAEQDKQQALAGILITSGFNFDGYSVVKYSGYISGDDAISVNRGRGGIFSEGPTDVAASLMEALVVMRRNALAELKEAAYMLGCNAVIGVDFDYLTLEPETVGSNGGTLYLPYVFGVTANGNAVVIERTLS